MMIRVLLVLVYLLIVNVSFADIPETPIKFSLFDKIAVPEKNDVVDGLEIGISSYTYKLKGLSLNFIFSRIDEGMGIQVSPIILTKSFAGVQAGVINLNSSQIRGLQWGFFNKAKSVRGFQIGLVNMTEDLHGVQIGFINFIETGYFSTMVIANAKF